jgi:hypothetical protein
MRYSISFATACTLAFGACSFVVRDCDRGPPAATATSLIDLHVERVRAAQRVLELWQEKRDDLRQLHQAGRVDAQGLFEVETAVEEARIRLLTYRLELAMVETKRARDSR